MLNMKIIGITASKEKSFYNVDPSAYTDKHTYEASAQVS